jgi:hypothetical protein
MDGVNQYCQGQLAKGVHPGLVPAAREELSGQDAFALNNHWFGELVHVAAS